METIKLNKEFNKLSKLYFKLENIDFRSGEEQKKLDKIEKRLAEISTILESK